MKTLLSLLILAGLHGPIQVGRIWTFEELLKESQVAVMANVVRTVDTGRKVQHPGLNQFPGVEIETEFQILAVMKAGAESSVVAGSLLILHHYRHDWDQWRADHPTVPGQPPPSVVNTGTALVFERKSGPYVLFLIKTKGGYEPVSGHTFPTASVFRLEQLHRPPGVVATIGESQVSNDEYAVWTAVIDDMFARRSNVGVLVLNDRTVSDQSRALEKQEYLRGHFPSVTAADIANFVDKNREAHQLRDDFKTELKHVLVKKDELAQIFKAGLDGWEEFYRRFPGSGGVVGMSRPGFNPALNQAFVYMEHSCGGLCGSGSYLLLVQSGGTWKVAKKLPAWVS